MSDLSNGIRINAIRYIVSRERGGLESRVSAVRSTAYRNETETEIFLEPSRMSSRALFTRINETRLGDTRDPIFQKTKIFIYTSPSI